MKYVAAVLLLNLAGNASPSAKDVKKILKDIGCDDIDEDKCSKICSAVEGKDMAELFEEGQKKMASMPSGA